VDRSGFHCSHFSAASLDHPVSIWNGSQLLGLAKRWCSFAVFLGSISCCFPLPQGCEFGKCTNGTGLSTLEQFRETIAAVDGVVVMWVLNMLTDKLPSQLEFLQHAASFVRKDTTEK
jgi:hypothetical protein